MNASGSRRWLGDLRDDLRLLSCRGSFFSLTVSAVWSALCFLSLPFRCKFFSLTETPEDYTIIVDEEGFKGGPRFVDLWGRCGNRRSGGRERSRCVIPDSVQDHVASAASVWAHFVIMDVRPSCQSQCFVVGWLSESMSLHTFSRATLLGYPGDRRLCVA